MKKIAIITDRIFPEYIGGYEILLYNISKILKDEFNVTIFTSMAQKLSYNKDGIEYYKVSKKRNYLNKRGMHNLKDFMFFEFNLLGEIKYINKFDLVIINTIPYFGIPYLLKKIEVKKISLFHEAWFEYLSKFNFLTREVLKNQIANIVKQTNFIISVSTKTTISLQENYGATDIITIPIGIDRIYEEFSEVEREIDVIFVGRLEKIKHVETIIKSLKFIKKDFGKANVVVVGNGNMSSKLKRDCINEGVEKNVIFLDNVDNEEKIRLLKKSKIFVSPSEREGFSISTLEAMANGVVPIVAVPEFNETFGTSDFVKDGINGLYFKLMDEEDLALKIRKLLEDKQLYISFQIKCIEESKKFLWNGITKKYSEVISNLIGK